MLNHSNQLLKYEESDLQLVYFDSKMRTLKRQRGVSKLCIILPRNWENTILNLGKIDAKSWKLVDEKLETDIKSGSIWSKGETPEIRS